MNHLKITVPSLGYLGDNFLLSSTINATLAILCNTMLITYIHDVVRAAVPSADDQISPSFQDIPVYVLKPACGCFTSLKSEE